MKTTKKKSMTGLITIVAIVAILISAGCIGEKTPPSVPTSTPTPAPTQTTTQGQPPVSAHTTGSDGAINVSELLDSPVYDTEVTVYGDVSALGELFCPCFALTSDGKRLEVWYYISGQAMELLRAPLSGRALLKKWLQRTRQSV